MRILKNQPFIRAAKAQGLTDAALKEAIEEVKQGLAGDKLGGNLYKKRVAIGGKGKRGGLRTILVYKASTGKVFCVYVFAKSQRDNITGKELTALKELGKFYVSMTDEAIKKALQANELEEVK